MPRPRLLAALPTLALAALALPALAQQGPSACPGFANAIVFSRDDPQTGYDIFVVQSDGTGLTHLDNNPGRWDGEPQWSPDHCRIAYSAKVKGSDQEIRIVNPDGSGMVTVIGTGSNDRFWNPSWSPDGTRIAFARAPRLPDGHLGEDDLWVVNVDGSNPVQLTDFPGDEHWIHWSPDGERIAFKAEVDGNNEIYLINADGTGLTNLSSHPMADMHPAWSPDGRRIAFVSNRTAYAEIHVMDADGTHVTQISHFGNTRPGAPQYLSWSPDGSQLVMSLDSAAGQHDRDLYVINADGSGLRNLTRAFSGREGDGARDVWVDW